jgi:2'-hydroxyisoflavone reductase
VLPEVLDEENACLAGAVVVLVDVLDLEAECTMKRDRLLVGGRRDRAHDRPRSHRLEEPLVQAAGGAGASPFRVDTDEMDVRLVLVGLGSEAAQEPDDRSAVVHHERRVTEVDEEQLREHRRHRPASPPSIDDTDHRCIVGGFGRADVHRVSVMRMLVLGGTEFLGRHVVDAALEHGHDVTLFNRGRTRPELFPTVEKLRGDRDGGVGALRGRSFDAVVDTSGYVPRIVAETIDALGEVGHYTFVSSISVYASLATPPTETSPVAELDEPTEEWREAYGELKALCEDVVRERFAKAFVARPGLIVGPWDPTGRFTYWPTRIADGGRVLAPAPPTASAQVIDARDLAAWIVRAAESGLSGTFNAVDRPTTRDGLFGTCRRVAGSDAELVWVDGDFLTEHGIGEWMELPLWLDDAQYTGMLSVDPTAAFGAGLETRPLEETVHATLAWARSGEAPAEAPAGLAREKERQVLDAWLSRQAEATVEPPP